MLQVLSLSILLLTFYGCSGPESDDDSPSDRTLSGDDSLSDDQNSVYRTAIESPTWAEVDAIVQLTCAGSTCHSGEGSQAEYVSQQEAFFESRASILVQLTSDLMPKGLMISEADEQTLINYIELLDESEGTSSVYEGIYKTALASPSWSDVDSILAATCAGAACHSSGAPEASYVGDEALFTINRAAIKSQLISNLMPKAGAITSPDKDTLLNFISDLDASGSAITACDNIPSDSEGIGIASPTWSEFDVISSATCSGGGCHDGKGNQKEYVGNEALVTANKEAIIFQLTEDRMPKTGSISAADKQTMYNFFGMLCD